MKERIDYSFDIETLGTRYDSYITSIACVQFSTSTGNIIGSWNSTIRCPEDQFNISADTVMWWMQQSEEARLSLVKAEPTPIDQALYGLSSFMDEDGFVWGNGATFDITILEYAYQKACSIKPPWKFWNVRDMRTIIDVARCAGFNPKAIVFEGTKHSAFHDARHQAKVISAAYQFLLEVPQVGEHEDDNR